MKRLRSVGRPPFRSTFSFLLVLFLTVSVLSTVEGQQKAVDIDAAKFLSVSTLASPNVSYALKRTDDQLKVVLEVQYDANENTPQVKLGIAGPAGREMLTEKKATVRTKDGRAWYVFAIPSEKLVERSSDWTSLRMGFTVEWQSGNETIRQRERFRHEDGRATHAPLSTKPSDWALLNLEEYKQRVKERRKRIQVRFEQPMNGKATLVIEDEEGNRIRNLVSGRRFSKGDHAVQWDGLNEEGEVVESGTYTWRGAFHPGIQPRYLMQFGNGNVPFLKNWGTNHSTFRQATSNDQYVFLASPVTEGGYALVALDPEGNWIQGYPQLNGMGLGTIAIAADDEYLYVAQDGFPWGDGPGEGQEWTATWEIKLVRYDIKSGSVQSYPGENDWVTIDRMEVGPGSDHPVDKGYNLGGMTLKDGSLFVSSRNRNAVLEVEPDTGDVTKAIDVDDPGSLVASRDGGLIGRSGRVVIRIQTDGRTSTVIDGGDSFDPRGIAEGKEGTVYVSDGARHTVNVFRNGRQRKEIGEPGGPYTGSYDPKRMVKPRGITVGPEGKLWVTEERWNPKRVHAWDVQAEKVVLEKFGPPDYGGSGAGFDREDHTRWVGLSTIWNVDFEEKTARPEAIFHEEAGHLNGALPSRRHYTFYRTNDRTFLIGFGQTIVISEVMDDGSLKDLAAATECHQFSYDAHWNPPEPFVNAFYEAFPGKDQSKASLGEKAPHAQKGPGVIWVDRNGDGKIQKKEFEFTPNNVQKFDGNGWGHLPRTLTLTFPVKINDDLRVLRLKPDGFHSGGAPRYPSLEQAVEQATSVPMEPGYQRTTAASVVDRFGNVILNSQPRMTSFSSDGEKRWSYPNRWVGVHGSHSAPLPSVGQFQGNLYFLGIERLDEESDVFMINGNFGRFFLMTSDGLYLDEMFNDIRISGKGKKDPYTIGDEPFGGYFGYSRKNDTYYVQAGNYRIFELSGLNEMKRQSGTIEVSKEQIRAAEQQKVREAAEEKETKTTSIPHLSNTPSVDGADDDWSDHTPIVSWSEEDHRSVDVYGGYRGENLFLMYRVVDSSPWVNRGKDWMDLFSTGDAVDFRMGTDPDANPQRGEAVRGDVRLLAAPFEGEPVLILYRYRTEDKKQSVTFTSPWRGYRVDSVLRLSDADVAVSRDQGGYTLELAVSLETLGLSNPQGTTYQGDFGVLYGDTDGKETILRSYWANQMTQMISDVPGEIMVKPRLWGDVTFK